MAQQMREGTVPFMRGRPTRRGRSGAITGSGVRGGSGDSGPSMPRAFGWMRPFISAQARDAWAVRLTDEAMIKLGQTVPAAAHELKLVAHAMGLLAPDGLFPATASIPVTAKAPAIAAAGPPTIASVTAADVAARSSAASRAPLAALAPDAETAATSLRATISASVCVPARTSMPASAIAPIALTAAAWALARFAPISVQTPSLLGARRDLHRRPGHPAAAWRSEEVRWYANS